MAKAPTTDHARARAAFVLGRITAREYADCLDDMAWVSGRYFLRARDFWQRGRRYVEIQRLPPIGTHRKGPSHG